MKYLIKEEHGELMRIVGRQEEALLICALRAGWTFKALRKPIKMIDWSKFEEALI